MKARKAILTVISLAILLAAWAVAGNLEPPGGPGPTMKSLDEVEPRIAINAENTPGDGDSTYKITEPGSYYLTDNIKSNFKHGILVEADDVTIDLMGFRIWSSWLLALPETNKDFDGIHIKGQGNVEIRNGTVTRDNRPNYKGFRHGILATTDLDTDPHEESGEIRIIDVRVTDCREKGIYLDGRGHLVKDCTVNNNGASATKLVIGIYTGPYSTVRGNTVYGNGNSARSVNGIFTNSGCTVTGNTVCYNGFSADDVYGIFAWSSSTVIGNTVNENGRMADGSVYGIFLGGGNLVDQNTATANSGNNGGTNMNHPSGCTFGINHAL